MIGTVRPLKISFLICVAEHGFSRMPCSSAENHVDQSERRHALRLRSAGVTYRYRWHRYSVAINKQRCPVVREHKLINLRTSKYPSKHQHHVPCAQCHQHCYGPYCCLSDQERCLAFLSARLNPFRLRWSDHDWGCGCNRLTYRWWIWWDGMLQYFLYVNPLGSSTPNSHGDL